MLRSRRRLALLLIMEAKHERLQGTDWIEVRGTIAGSAMLETTSSGMALGRFQADANRILERRCVAVHYLCRHRSLFAGAGRACGGAMNYQDVIDRLATEAIAEIHAMARRAIEEIDRDIAFWKRSQGQKRRWANRKLSEGRHG